MTKKILICIAIAVLAASLLLAFGACEDPEKQGTAPELKEVTVSQTPNKQIVTVKWTAENSVDKVTVNVKKSDGKTLESSVTIVDPSQIAKGSATLNASFGEKKVEVTVFNKNKSAVKEVTANVFADEYVIAPLVATMPVTLFSLQLKEITNNYQIPTFVWLQRGAAWNYSEMPENVFLVPVESFDVMSTYNDAGQMYIKTSKWVGELYKIHPDSKFHFYANDYHPYVWMQASICNQIPASQYDVTLLTDGTASNFVFEELYKKETAMADYARMTEEYKAFKQGLWNNHNTSDFNQGLGISSDDTRNYVLQMLEDEEINVKLVLTRAYFSGSNNADIAEGIKEKVTALTEQNKIQVVSLYGLLNELDEQGKEDIQSLYKFSDNMFEKAVTENKKAMVIMGTRTANEENFDEYVAAVKALYGDGYVYYYKGHPWTPTASDAEKAKHLEELGLIDIDSSISAELIFFFNPEIVGTGYPSTTYNSLTDEQVGGIFGTTMQDAVANYSENTKFVLNKIDKSNETYGSIATDNCYLFEFADTAQYSVAVYDVTSKSIKYYKTQDGGFTEVTK